MRKTSLPPSKLLADESLGLQVPKNIASYGYNIVAVAEVARGASDGEILQRAVVEKRVVITTDKDFGYLIYKEKLASHGVILVRLKDESIENLTLHLANFLNTYAGKFHGKFSVITEKKVRIKKI